MNAKHSSGKIFIFRNLNFTIFNSQKMLQFLNITDCKKYYYPYIKRENFLDQIFQLGY